MFVVFSNSKSRVHCAPNIKGAPMGELTLITSVITHGSKGELTLITSIITHGSKGELALRGTFLFGAHGP